MGGITPLNRTGFRQQNRPAQAVLRAPITAITDGPAARVILTMNPLAVKSIPNVLSEIPALRFGCQQRFVHGPRTREVTIDIALVESQVQLLCAGPIGDRKR